MQWWCSAQNAAWSWSWQPYPGVWAFLLGLAVGYGLLRRRFARAGDPGRPGFFAAGLVLLWLALDWPVGALGAGYLLSVHMAQFLVIALIVPHMLLLGVPRGALEALVRRPVAGAGLRFVTHPLVALALFNTVLIATHLPNVLDSLKATQLGSFGMDTAWLAAGLALWWPVVCSVPERPRFHTLVKVGYLIANTVLNTAPFAFIAFAEFPIYAVYELAPPIGGISTLGDQQLAGFMMKIGGAVVVWTAIAILFLRWARAEERESMRAPA